MNIVEKIFDGIIDALSSLFSYILSLISSLLPDFIVNSTFITALDSGIAVLIKFIDLARWFFPVDVFVTCVGIILLIDNWSLVTRFFKWIIDLIRG